MTSKSNINLVRDFILNPLAADAKRASLSLEVETHSILCEELSMSSMMILFTVESQIRSKEKATDARYQSEAAAAYLRLMKLAGVDSFLADQQDKLGLRMHLPKLTGWQKESDTLLSLASRADLIGSPKTASTCPSVLARAGCYGIEAYFEEKDASWAFLRGCDNAIITHKSQEEIYACGFYAALVSELAEGKGLAEALSSSLKLAMMARKNSLLEECIRKLPSIISGSDTGNYDIDILGDGRSVVSILTQSIYAITKSKSNGRAQMIGRGMPGDESVRAILIAQMDALIGAPGGHTISVDVQEVENLICRWTAVSSDAAL